MRAPSAPAKTTTAALLFLALLAGAASGDELATTFGGRWEGTIEVPGHPLLVMLDLTPPSDAAGAWSGTIDIPTQAARGLPLTAIEISERRARFTIAGVPGTPTFDGAWRDGELRGQFTQGAARLAFRLGREALPPVRRPQDPVAPLPYSAEEVSYRNAAVTLAGTLTLPPGPGPFPAAVLVSGSGPQNRDQEIFEHRPFLVLADALTRRGIAVLRSDDRGVGGSSGDVHSATSADFARDALAAIALLAQRPEIDPSRIGIIGHSEGGLVGPLAAAQSEAVAFVVMLAGPGVPGHEILPLQARLLARAAGGDPAMLARQADLVRRIAALVVSEEDSPELRAQLIDLALEQLELGGPAAREAMGEDPEAVLAQQIDGLLTPWFRYFLAHDPAPILARVEVPVLALNGELDLQVDAEQNLPAIAAALAGGGNPDVTIERLPGLNHLFQHATTGAPTEYGSIDETLAPEVLTLIGDWIEERFGAAAPPAVAPEG